MALSFTVLYAEDESTIRDAVAEALSLAGFRVLTAESGYEALRLLTQESVDVLLTDIVMPGLDGVELARRAKALRPELQVMFATAYASRAAQAIHLGKLLYKPLRAREIDAELRTMLATR